MGESRRGGVRARMRVRRRPCTEASLALTKPRNRAPPRLSTIRGGGGTSVADAPLAAVDAMSAGTADATAGAAEPAASLRAAQPAGSPLAAPPASEPSESSTVEMTFESAIESTVETTVDSAVELKAARRRVGLPARVARLPRHWVIVCACACGRMSPSSHAPARKLGRRPACALSAAACACSAGCTPGPPGARARFSCSHHSLKPPRPKSKSCSVAHLHAIIQQS